MSLKSLSIVLYIMSLKFSGETLWLPPFIKLEGSLVDEMVNDDLYLVRVPQYGRNSDHAG